MEIAMSQRSRSHRFITGLAAVFAIALVGVAAPALAQDATQTPQATVTHPAHVHKGSCAELDPNPAYPLDNVGPRLKDDELPPAEDIKGSLTAAPIEVSETEIEVSLDDLLVEAHAINVHESDQNIQNYIACGDIGGPVIDDKLYIGLVSLNGSGYAGVAELEGDGDNTNVKIYLGRDLGGLPVDGTPAAGS
jgi:hypothetical protein